MIKTLIALRHGCDKEFGVEFIMGIVIILLIIIVVILLFGSEGFWEMLAGLFKIAGVLLLIGVGLLILLLIFN